jgi:nucleoside-diphosphate-sugar epimerase
VATLLTVRAFVTGATGFIGSHLARRLRERGDEVVALVRTPAKAEWMRDLGCQLVEGDLASVDTIRKGCAGCDAAFHVAAIYEVGVPKSRRAELFDVNVRGTERVLDAAAEAGVARIVYVSTIGAFGNTRGRVVDETYGHPHDRYLTLYEETKVLAHDAALDRIARGHPVLLVQPGGVYGPGDTSDLASLMDRVRKGQLPFRFFPETGFNFLHVDDAVTGILLSHDRGRIGESYVLGGQLATMGEMISAVARASGRRPPRLTAPPWLIKAGIPFGTLIGKALGTGPNLAEMIRAAEGVTYWATDEKARRELGYLPRDLETGVRDTFGLGSARAATPGRDP